MNRLMNYAAALISFVFLIFLWISYFESGCWGISGRSRASLITFCGNSGLATGLVFSVAALYAVYIWLFKKKD